MIVQHSFSEPQQALNRWVPLGHDLYHTIRGQADQSPDHLLERHVASYGEVAHQREPGVTSAEARSTSRRSPDGDRPPTGLVPAFPSLI
jgi:hypothetical protein